jgi:hypothetical protein
MMETSKWETWARMDWPGFRQRFYVAKEFHQRIKAAFRQQ